MKIERVCACGCGKKFMARRADVKRGWGKYASKSCKAKAQTKRLGKYHYFKEERLHPMGMDNFDIEVDAVGG